MKPATLCLSIILTANLCASQNSDISQDAGPSGDTRDAIGFVKGFSWGTFGRRGDYSGTEAAESMRRMAETGADFACIVFSMNMKTRRSVELLWDQTNPRMASDADIRNAIGLAKEQHLKVILKPTVNCNDGTWRGHIDFKTENGQPDTEQWRQWWANYTTAMLHYADLAAETGCQAYCIGCEMNGTEVFETEWRALIMQLRERFKGVLIYNVNHGREEHLTWWDAVDIIGISAYYPVGTRTPEEALSEKMNTLDHTSSLEQMKESWKPIRERLDRLAAQWNRPVLFIEIGVRSAKGSSAIPWEYYNDWPYDGEEQARYYQAALETFWDQPWFAGFAWWAWDCSLYPAEAAAGDKGFCPYGKPAEAIIRQWYAKERK
jgi:hypothetical protein